MGRKKALRMKQALKLANIFDKKTSIKNKGKWSNLVFENDKRIVLELACGKGEYSLELAKMFPDRNFIGIDRKADRLWCGSTKAIEESLKNVAFIKGKIEILNEYFAKNEISEIWITFPDPFLKKPNQRLTSEDFLKEYEKIMRSSGVVHLKTDEIRLYNFTIEVLKSSNHDIVEKTSDLFNSSLIKDPKLQITTTYERKHIAEGDKICYLKFNIRKDLQDNPPFRRAFSRGQFS
ncbi:MAG: tRNA (guanosine(46)-N7)-methyltransferase TrmB [Patescibacteria group bacterium]|nr:tRNA (guanosine(46)-N7)-methyltransferase TrmB [Patescibacteria group bacterium]